MEKRFYSGSYRQILSASIDSVNGGYQVADLPFIIGSLTFQGRLHEAELLFGISEGKFEPFALFFCRFFLGVSYCRISDYEKARQFFGKNLREGGRHPDLRVRFFAWQGLGFYRLFFGRYHTGFTAARRAFTTALEGNYLYGKALAADLMAHNQILPGQISSALKSFDDAIEYSQLLGDGGLLQAFTVSRKIHSAQFGLAPASDLLDLEQLLLALTAEDNYSRSRLLLEIGRQHTLRGNVRLAKQALNRACQLIYSSKNRRYSILLNLRYAQLLYLAGDFHQALNLTRNAKSELDLQVDVSLSCEVHGQERQILEAIGKDAIEAVAASAENPVVATSTPDRSGKAIHRRIIGRSGGQFQNQRFLGDDPLGDLVDLCQQNKVEASREICETGYLGLIYSIVPETVGKRVIYFDLLPGSLIVLNLGQVVVHQNGSSSVIRTLAKHLAAGREVGKEELIEKIWGYRYQSLKHDPLIYRNISRFRAMLAPCEDWIEVTETGYRFSQGIEVLFHRAPISQVLQKESLVLGPQQNLEGLNYRQLRILEALGHEKFLDARFCTELLQVSEVTVRRDLNELGSRSLIKKSGKGRATRYALEATSGPIN